jgi:hypothetical protein
MTEFDEDPLHGGGSLDDDEAWLRRRLHGAVADEEPSDLLLPRVRQEVEKSRRGSRFLPVAAVAAAAAAAVVTFGLTRPSADQDDVALTEVTEPGAQPDPTYRDGGNLDVGSDDAEEVQVVAVRAAVSAADVAGRATELQVTLAINGGPRSPRTVFWTLLPNGDRHRRASVLPSPTAEVVVDLRAGELERGGWSRWEVTTGGVGQAMAVADVRVPDLVGLSESDAAAVASAIGLRPFFGPPMVCGRPAGAVCAQSLPAGAVVGNASRISLQIQA